MFISRGKKSRESISLRRSRLDPEPMHAASFQQGGSRLGRKATSQLLCRATGALA